MKYCGNHIIWKTSKKQNLEYHAQKKFNEKLYCFLNPLYISFTKVIPLWSQCKHPQNRQRSYCFNKNDN
jgi:hypothetical protein